MNDEQFQSIYGAYQQNPFIFRSGEVDFLQRYAQNAGVDFQRNNEADEFDLMRTIGELGEGWISGFTTMNIGKEPSNIYEGIARSLGHLLGFVGWIPGPGLVGRLGANTIAKAFGRGAGVGRFFDKLAKGPTSIKLPSVPMTIANKVLQGVGTAMPTVRKFLAENRYGYLAQGGLHLGIASAAGAWQGGVDSMVQSFGHGAVAGAGFRAIASFSDVGKLLKGVDPVEARRANAVVRSISSSIFQGLPQTLAGAPLELQVYDYILGAYFGFNERSFASVNAQNFIRQRIMKPAADEGNTAKEIRVGIRDRLMDPERVEGFQDLPRDVQDEVLFQAQHQFGRQLARGDEIYTTTELLNSKVVDDLLKEGVIESKAEFEDWVQMWSSKAKVMAETVTPVEAPSSAEMGRTIDALGDPTFVAYRAVQRISERSKLSEAMADHELPSSLEEPLTGFLRSTGLKNEDLATVSEDVFKAFSSRYRVKGGFDEAVKELKEKYPDLKEDPDDPGYASLRKAWHNGLGKMVDQSTVFLDPRTGEITVRPKEGVDAKGNRIDRRAQHNYLEEVLGPVTLIEDMTTWNLKTKRYQDAHLYDDNNVNLYSLLKSAAENHMPFLSAVKDKGKGLHGYGWLFESNGVYNAKGEPQRITWEEGGPTVLRNKIERLNEVYREAGQERSATEAYEDLFQRFLTGYREAGFKEDIDTVRDIYDRYTLNNMAFMESLNQIPVEEMFRDNFSGKGQFITRFADLNKRMQPMADGNAIPEEGFSSYKEVKTIQDRGGLPYIILKETNAAGTLKGFAEKYFGGVDKMQDQHLDGVFFLHPSAYDALRKDMGLDPVSGTLKGTIVYGNEKGSDGTPLGMYIGKLAFFKADPSIQKTMDAQGVLGLAYTSASKQTGRRKVYEYQVDPQTGETVYSRGGVAEAPDSYVAPLSAFRMNTAVSENVSHALKRQNAPRQMLSNLEDDVAIERYIKNFVEPSINGVPEVNQKVEQFLQTRDSKLIEDLDVDDISVKNLLSILTNPEGVNGVAPGFVDGNALYQKVWRHIFRADKENPVKGEDWEDIETVKNWFTQEGNQSSAARIIEILSKENLLDPVIIHDELLEGYAMTALRNYVTKRAVSPRIDYSGTAIFQPTDPWFRRSMLNKKGRQIREEAIDKDGYVKEGYVVLGNEYKRWKVQGENGEDTTLGELWGKYIAKKKAGEDVEKLEDLLELAIIRVPADSLSGTRMLKFAGFSGRAGAGGHLSNMDMVYLGGADLDIDKGFVFQNLDRSFGKDKPISNHIKSAKYQWHTKDSFNAKGEKIKDIIVDATGNKDEFAEPLVGGEQDPFSVFDPRLRMMAGRSARQGNITLGIPAVSGRRGNLLHKLYQGQVLEGVVPTPVIAEWGLPRGTKLGFRAKVAEDRSAFDAARREAMNFAADAANFPKLKKDLNAVSSYLSSKFFSSYEYWVMKGDRFVRPVSKKEFAAGAPAMTWLNVMKPISTIDKYANGQRMDGKVPGLFDFMYQLKEFPKDLPNGWYKSLAMLDSPFYPIGHFKTGEREAMMEERRWDSLRHRIAPYIGNNWDKYWRKEFERIMAGLEPGSPDYDPRVAELLTIIGADKISLGATYADVPANRRARRAGQTIPYKDAWAIQNDMSDMATVINLYRKGKAMLDAGYSMKEVKDVAAQVTRFKDEVSKIRAVARREREPNKELLGDVYKQIEDWKTATFANDKGQGQAFFDAYMLGTYYSKHAYPERTTMGQWLDIRKAELKPKWEALSQEEAGTDFTAWFEKSGHRKEALDQWFKTQQVRLGFELPIIADQSILDYFKIKSNIYKASTKDRLTEQELKEIDTFADPSRHKPFEDALKAQGVSDAIAEDAARLPAVENYAYGSRFFENIQGKADWYGEFMADPKIPLREKKELERLRGELKDIFTRNPSIIRDFPAVFEYVTSEVNSKLGKADLGVSLERATLQDIRNFIRFMNGARDGTVVRDLINGEGMKWSNWWHYVFPEVIGEKTLPFDTNVPVDPTTGRGYISRPIMTSQGVKMKEVAPVFSHFGKAHEFMSLMETWKSKEIETMQRERDNYFGFLDRLTFRGEITSDGQELMEMATAMRLFRVGEWISKNKKNSSEAKFYKKFYAERIDRFREKFADKVYSMPLADGTTKRVTGAELVGTPTQEGIISQRVTQRMREIYETKIYNPDKQRKWLVTRDGTPYDPSLNTTEGLDPYASLRKITKHLEESRDTLDLDMEGLYKIIYEIRLREQMKVPVTFYNKQGKKVKISTSIEDHVAHGRITPERAHKIMKNLRRKYPFVFVNEVPFENYWPQNNHDMGKVREYFASIKEQMEKKGSAKALTDQEIALMKQAVARNNLSDAGMADWLRDVVMDGRVTPGIQMEFRPPSLNARSERVIGGFGMDIRSLQTYDQQMATSYFKTLQALVGNRLVKSFKDPYGKRAEKPMGENNAQWAKFLEMYVRDVIGESSLYPESWIKDGDFRLQQSPTWFMSSHYWFEKMKKLGLPWFKDAPIGGPKSKKFDREMAHWSQLEGQYQLMTLLANTKGMTNNMVGGTFQTVISAGFRHWWRAGSLTYLNRVNPKWDNWDAIARDVLEKGGAIESYITSEAHIPQAFKSGNGRRMWNELWGAIKRDPNITDRSLGEIMKKYGANWETMTEGGAWFMRSVERRLRRRAFLAHYLKAREAFGGGDGLRADHPWLLEMARKGVEATQFLYDNANRPAFARTSLGRVFTRFQMWALRSIHFRSEIYKEAIQNGFTPGTPDYERFQRLATTDLFVFALAALFPFSVFENTLPAPLSYLKEFADFFFGDEEERDKAFFGVIPYPFSPLQVVLPPISRHSTALFSSLVSGDWERFASYHMWTWFPFGMLGRNAYRTLNNPAYAIENLTGMPLHAAGTEHREIAERNVGRYGLWMKPDGFEEAMETE